MRSIFERLDATPGQEKVIAAAAEEVRAALRKHRGELGATRQDLAKAARAEVFDEVLFGELYARQDAAIAELRAAMMGALAKIHAVLEPEQREELGRLIEGGIFRGPWGGPGHDGSHHDGRWS